MELKFENKGKESILILDFSKDSNVSEGYKSMMKDKYEDLLKVKVEVRG